MVSCKIEIINPMGLHLRPAMELCGEVQKYHSSVHLQVRQIQANAKSVLNILAAGIRFHDEVEIVCCGEDEQEALSAVKKLLCSDMGRLILEEETNS